MEKYYTPLIEEFHYGFQFEYKHPLQVAGEEAEWALYDWRSLMATITLHPKGISIGGFSIKDECLRVKYLDVGDCEELGWKHIGSQWYDLIEVPGKLGYWLYVRFRKCGDESFIKAYRYDPKEKNKDTEGENYQEEDFLFSGNIKNKSEFKKLMIQLGIK